MLLKEGKRRKNITRFLAVMLTVCMSSEPVWILQAEEEQIVMEEEIAAPEEIQGMEESSEEVPVDIPEEVPEGNLTETMEEEVSSGETEQELYPEEEQILGDDTECYDETEFCVDSEGEQILGDEVEFCDETELAEADLLMAAAQAETQVKLYALNPAVTEISIPSDMPTGYQIVVPDTGEKAFYRVASGNGISVDENGYVVPKTQKATVISGSGSTVREEYSFGENTVQVTQGKTSWTITVAVENYAVYYAEKRMDDYIAQNIVPSLSEYEKVKAVCEWISKNFNYSTGTSDYVGLMVFGGGDCWANTGAVNYMCRKMGITAYTRYAANDPGAGGGHRNSIVIIDGEKYLADCGYTGNAPRYYTLRKMDKDFSVQNLGDGTVKIIQYEGTEKDVIVPESIDGKKVTAIGPMAFANGIVEIESVTLPDSITTLEDNAFFRCSKLKKIRIPKNVSSIGQRVFGGGYSGDDLTEINVDPSNPYFTTKDGVLFDKSGRELVAFPSGKSGKYSIPDGTEQIGDYAFYCCDQVTEIEIPQSVKVLEEGAFGDCSKLSKVNIPDGLEEIGDFAFSYDYQLPYVVIPASVKRVGDGAFMSGTYKLKVMGMSTVFGKKVLTQSKAVMMAGVEGSTAESYAKENSCKFINVNGKGEIELEGSWFKEITGEFTYSGKEQIPRIWLTQDAPTLYEGTDYELTYKDNINAGTATVTIRGTGLFSGTVEKHFEIQPQKIWSYKNVCFKQDGSTYLVLEETGKEVRPEVSVPDYVEGKDYDVIYYNNIEPGLATAEICWKENYTGNKKLYFTIIQKRGSLVTKPEEPDERNEQTEAVKKEDTADVSVQKRWEVKSKKTSVVYNGKAQKPGVIVKENGKTVKSSYYSVSYKNNKYAGTATVTVTGKGKYKGYKAKVVFVIKPQKTSFTRVKGIKDGISLKWKKNSQASGYQIQYSTDRKFKKNVRMVTVSKGTKVSYTVKKAGRKKTYYVRIRAYKTSGTTRIYGDWSNAKKIKTT